MTSSENVKVYVSNCYNTGEINGNNKYGILYCDDGVSTELKYTYFLNNIEIGTNIEDIDSTTQMTEAEMKTSSFVDTLNNNIVNIDLSNYGLGEYTLSTWKQGASGYPELE